MPSALLNPENDPAPDALLAESTRVQCDARRLVRAVPALGGNRVLWRMPHMPLDKEPLWLAIAYASRYGAVYLTDRFELRGKSASSLTAAPAAASEDDERKEEL